MSRSPAAKPTRIFVWVVKVSEGMPMSEQVSATHGPVEDDAIKRQDRSDLQARGEEWPDPESADAEGGAVWAPEGRFAGTRPLEDWQAIELRSDLARRLNRTAFPATRSHLLEVLDAQDSGQRLVDLVSSLPDGASFGNLGELLRGLGLPVEGRPGG
jgi:Protein of unknown function (DUF2795)